MLQGARLSPGFERLAYRVISGKVLFQIEVLSIIPRDGPLRGEEFERGGSERHHLRIDRSHPPGTQFNGKFWLEFWLEKSLQFWIEIPYTKKMFKIMVSLDMYMYQN